MSGSGPASETFQNALSNINDDLHGSRHMPGGIYTSSDVYTVERDQIFLRSWLCVGREEETPQPGDFFASRIMGEPFLVVRNGAGAINAFANSCRHRGVEVASGRGNAKQFSCPYHAWTYDLNGRLLGAPLMQESRTDLSQCALPSLAVEVWQGWVFINFDPDAKPLHDTIADFVEEFGFLRGDQCRLANVFSTELDCNWKYVVENLMDVYHVGTVHAQSFGKHYRDSAEDHSFKLFDKGGYSFHFKAAPLTSGGESLFGPMPALSEHPSDFACLGFIAPNMNFVARWDSMRFWITWPLTPEKSQLLGYTLFSEAAFDDPEFSSKVDQYTEFLTEFVEEDRDMMESLQNGSGAKRFDPGPMSRLEQPIHHVVQHYLKSVAGS